MNSKCNIYYEKSGKQCGPVSYEELKQLNINGDTLIWYEGLSEWKRAEELPELKELFDVTTPPPLPPKINEENQIASSIKEICSTVEKRGHITSEDRFTLQRIVGQILCNVFSKPLEDSEKYQVEEIEIRNIYTLIMVTMQVLNAKEPISLLPQIFQNELSKKSNKLKMNPASFYGVKVSSAIKYIMADGRNDFLIQIQGKVPKKGVFGFRQAEADKWWQNYCQLTISKIRFILQYSECNKDEALAFLAASSVYYLCKSQPHKFRFEKDESPNDGTARMAILLTNFGSKLVNKS